MRKYDVTPKRGEKKKTNIFADTKITSEFDAFAKYLLDIRGNTIYRRIHFD